jgi:2-aminoethylphosphonate-pyruvate transaminase
MDADIPYLLLTPGPLTTSRTVRQAMLADYSTWDVDYNAIVTRVRESLVRLATEPPGSPPLERGDRTYTCTLMQGSGTFAVEATIGSAVPADGKILIVNNGAYGKRMVETAARLRIDHVELAHVETDPPDLKRMRAAFEADRAITHVAMAHCETTTGMLNPAEAVGHLAREFGKKYILDAMSSFAGVPMTMDSVGADFLISSANKCVQGVPGFGFVIASRAEMESLRGRARSLSLDLWDQWQEMESKGGKWRYTSPTHVVCAFAQALKELEEEGGVAARHRRYSENQRRLVDGMEAMGFRTLIPREWQSPIITSFHNPVDPKYSFPVFYDKLKARRFVIYPGKVSQADCFRIGTIGHVFPEDIESLLENIRAVIAETGVSVRP